MTQPAGQRHGCLRSAMEMQAQPEFEQLYAPVSFEASASDEPHAQPVRSVTWVRRESAIGIRRQPDEVFVPGYLLATSEGVVAREHDDGRLGAVVMGDHPGQLLALPLPAGRWRLTVESVGLPVALRVASTPSVRGRPGRPLSFTASGAPVDLEVHPAGDGLSHVFALHLERHPVGPRGWEAKPHRRDAASPPVASR